MSLVVAVGLVSAPLAAASQAPSPVSEWQGDGNANDSVGTSNGTLVDGGYAPGQNGQQAFNLDGQDDYVNIPSSAMASVTGAISASAWVKPAAFTDEVVLTQYDTHDANTAFNLEVLSGGKIEWFVVGPGCDSLRGDARTVQTIASIPLGQWTQITGTFDPTTQQLHVLINGQVVQTQMTDSATVPALCSSSAPVRIGGGAEAIDGTFGNFFNGEIQDVKLYNQDISVTAGGPPPPSCAVSLLPGTHEPALVAVFVDGVQTSTPNDNFYPLDYGFNGSANHSAVNSYCSPYKSASYGAFPPSLSGVLGGYDCQITASSCGIISPLPSEGVEILTDTLARQGAVFLPYSYRGAYFSSCPGAGSAPLFHVNYSASRDPGNTDVNTQASLLWGEVQSIHGCWPHSAIEIIADSGGGVPAEYYWNTGFQADRAGVKHIFTLDSPINGLDHTAIESVVDNHLGPVVRDFYGFLWNNLDANDAQEIGLDGDGSFRPIGTIGDYSYVLGDMRWESFTDPDTEALLSQLLMNCSGGLSDTCAVAPPSYVSPCSGTDYSGDASHELVRICKPTVDYIARITAGDLSSAETSQLRSRFAREADFRAAGTGEADALTHSASARPPERNVPGPGPAAKALLYAASPGSRITIHGGGLGATAGSVSFSGPAGPGTVAGRVLSWTDTAVTVRVPGATSGPITLRTSAGESLLASSLAVLSRGRVAHLRIRTTAPTTGGEAEYVYATALDGRSRPLAGVPVELFNGSTDTQRTTNRHGNATFAVADFGAQDLLVHAQGASKPVHLVWRPPRIKLFTAIGISLLRARSALHHRLALTVQTALGGALTAKAWICAAQHGSCRRVLRYGSGRASAATSGTTILSITPSPAARRALRHHRRARVQLDLTLRTASKHSVTAAFIVFVTF